MGNYGTVIYLVALVGIFYFMIIRPQQQRQKQQQNIMNNLEPNLKITTFSGILGTIVKVKENTILLKVADNVNIEILKSAVASVNKE